MPNLDVVLAPKTPMVITLGFGGDKQSTNPWLEVGPWVMWLFKPDKDYNIIIYVLGSQDRSTHIPRNLTMCQAWVLYTALLLFIMRLRGGKDLCIASYDKLSLSSWLAFFSHVGIVTNNPLSRFDKHNLQNSPFIFSTVSFHPPISWDIFSTQVDRCISY